MTKTTKTLQHILVLPRWYPNTTDIQLGIFIQRQIMLMAPHFKFTVIYAQALSTLEQDFKVVTTQPTKNVSEHIIYFKSDTGPFRKLHNLKKYKKAQQLGLNKIESSIDICHVHVPYRSAMPALNLKKKNGTPFLITEHWSGHLNGDFQRKNAADKLLYKRTLKKALKISTVSEALRTAFKKNTGFDSTVIPNFIERQKMNREKKSSERIHILSVGDFNDAIKNITGLLKAFKAAVVLDPRLELTIVGGGPDEKLIKKTVEELNFEPGQLRLTGRQNHTFVLNEMLNCDFYVCNSVHETFGMTVAEALLCGKPVVSTRCGGPEEFLTAENSILIAPKKREAPNDWEALFVALQKMSDTYQNYNTEQISAQLDSRFGKAAVEKKWLDFYSI